MSVIQNRKTYLIHRPLKRLIKIFKALNPDLNIYLLYRLLVYSYLSAINFFLLMKVLRQDIV